MRTLRAVDDTATGDSSSRNSTRSSRRATRRRGAIAIPSTPKQSARTRVFWRGCRLQLRAEQLLHLARVGPALRLLHHLADQGVDHALLAASELLDARRVCLDHLVDHRLELRAVADRGKPVLLDQLCRRRLG